MMNSKILLLSILLIVVGYSYALSVSHSEWASYKLAYNKTYPDEETESMRRNIFMKNKNTIDTFNANLDESSYVLGLNHLSDLDDADFRTFGGPSRLIRVTKNSLMAERFLQSVLNNDDAVPDELDWRKVPGRVSRVKDQGKNCHSDWAFAVTGALEGQELVRTNNTDLIPLSEQNLMDCTVKNDGCTAGMYEFGFDHAMTGINDEKSYPYEAKNGKCRFNKDKSIIADNGHAHLPLGDEETLKKVVAKFGPVAAGVSSRFDSFRFYKHGVYYNDQCPPSIMDQAVLIVGYGKDPKQGDYWLVKNSWTANWGEEGYIRMARNRNNNCAIASDAVIPIF